MQVHVIQNEAVRARICEGHVFQADAFAQALGRRRVGALYLEAA
jgi:hypothetical protein